MVQVILYGIIVGSIYALIALGFNLIYSAVRFYHILYGALALLASYMVYDLQGRGIHFAFAIVIAIVVSGVLGIIFWQWLYRPMVQKKSSSLVLLVASFGAFIVMSNVLVLLWGTTAQTISITNEVVAGTEFMGMNFTFNQIVIFLTAITCIILLELFLKKTKYGMAIRAISDNAPLTVALGLRTNFIICWVFFIGTALSALSAILFSLEYGVRPSYGLMLILKAIIATIIGGVGSMTGALLGGFFLGIGENVGMYFVGSNWQDTISFGLLTIFLLLRPGGIIRKKTIGK